MAAATASWEDGLLERCDDLHSVVFIVKNVKCAACASAIQQNLTARPGVRRVDVTFPGGPVTVHVDILRREAVANKLAEIGYPGVTP